MTRIIGISGKATGGKTTAAKIIQYITSQQMYPSLVTESLEEFIEEYGDQSNPVLYSSNEGAICSPWQIKSFAYKLKLFASMLTGIPVERFDDQDLKESYMPAQWGRITYREFLKRLGTDGMRDMVHPDIHVNGLFIDYTPSSHWLIPDVRFRNEVDAIKARGGLVFYIDRNTGAEDSHVSETQMNTFRDQCDAQIDNNGTIQDLTYRLRSVLVQYNILPTATA